MNALSFADRQFDLIWSEGAIYIMGFSEGLTAWKRFLRPGGAVAVTELTWLTRAAPELVQRFLAKEYAAMADLDENRAKVAQAGYELSGDFVLPEADWWDGYYTELESRIAAMRNANPDDIVEVVLAEEQQEIDVFRAREDSYGYVFYVMQLVA